MNKFQNISSSSSDDDDDDDDDDNVVVVVVVVPVGVLLSIDTRLRRVV